MSAINVVSLVGVLTEPPSPWDVDPERKGATLHVAVNEHVKRDGEWIDVAGHFDVAVPGKEGEACVEHLHEGSWVGVAGRLRPCEDGAGEVVAASVQFLSPVREAVAA